MRMRNTVIVLASLNLATYLLAYLLWQVFDLFGLLFVFLNIFVLPPLFCGFTKRLAESVEVPRKHKKIVVWSCASAMIAMDIVVFIIRFKTIMTLYIPIKGVLYLICAIWALLNYHLDRPSGNKKTAKIFTIIFATMSLLLNALLFFPYAPWHELIYYELLLILPFLFALTSISSYLIGKMVSKPHIKVKLIAWFLGILASLFSLACCYDAFGYGTIIYGTLAAAIMFMFSIVGVSRQKKRERLNPVQS